MREDRKRCVSRYNDPPSLNVRLTYSPWSCAASLTNSQPASDHMAGQGATLQNFNNELVKCIEDLREKREAVNTSILKEEEEKAKIQKDLSILTDRLSKINESLARRVMARNEYDKTIQETEAAYMKILESSQTLLHVLKRETVNLTKKKQYSS